MDFVGVDELQLMTGVDIPVEGIGVTIRQPSIKEISMLGETNYFIALQLFTMTKEQLMIKTPDVTNWRIFQESITQKITGVADTKVLVMNFLQLFFRESINLGPHSLLLMTKDGVHSIEPEDFDYIQQVVGAVGGKSLLSSTDEKFNPKNKRAAEIAAKMRKARERLSRVKALQGGGATNKGFLKKYIKTVATGTANSLEQVNNMTLLQLSDMMKIFLAKEAYDIEIKNRLAGSKNDKELVHWSVAEDKDDSIGQM